MADDDARYELFYWPSIQGRGEFVRLALEAAGAPYVDVARLPADQGGGAKVMQALLADPAGGGPFFAPPILRHGDVTLSQTAAILQYLGPRLRLVPDDEASRLRANHLQLTIADFVLEAHDTHHPIASSLYYEDQKAEAARRAHAFVQSRLPKYLGYFERVVEAQRRGRGPACRGRGSVVRRSVAVSDHRRARVRVSARAFTRRRQDAALASAARSRGRGTGGRRLPAVPATHSVQPARHLPELPGAGRLNRCRRQAVQLTVYMCTWAGEPAWVEVTVTWPPALIAARFAAVSVTACMCPNATLVSTI